MTEDGLLQLDVEQGVVDVFMSEEVHNVKDVFGLMVENCCLPMSERVKVICLILGFCSLSAILFRSALKLAFLDPSFPL